MTTIKRSDLRAELARRDISVTTLAAKVGISRGHLSDVLHGRRALPDRLAKDISRESGIPLEQIKEPAGVA